MSTHHVTIKGRTYKVVLSPGAAPVVDGVAVPVDVRELSPGVLSLLLTTQDGTTRSLRAIADPDPAGDAIHLDGRRIAYTLADPRSLRAAQVAAGGDAGPKPLKAPMPGRIVRVLVAEGETVEAGQGCVVIEAMKMQNELKAPRGGVVTRLAAAVGETVAANAVLLVIQ